MPTTSRRARRQDEEHAADRRRRHDGARVLKRTVRGKIRADLIDHVFHYGTPGDVPVAGDWNGDGIRQIGVFRDGQWILDLDGDGRFTERCAWPRSARRATCRWSATSTATASTRSASTATATGSSTPTTTASSTRQDKVFELGGAGDQPVVGDWNGDGTDEPGVYQPAQRPIAWPLRRLKSRDPLVATSC